VRAGVALAFALTCASASTAAQAQARVRFDPATPRLGDLVVAYVSDPSASVGVLTVFDHEHTLQRIDATRLRAVIAVPVDTEPGRYAVEVDLDGEARDTELVVVDRPWSVSKLTVSRRFTEKPSRELKARLAAEERAWAAMFAAEPTPPAFSGGFIRPVSGSTTSPFGTKRMFNGRLKTRHYGLDLDGDIGAPIRAMQAGRVVMSAMRFTSGGTIVIDHGNGLFSAYFHLSRRLKKRGQWVKAGELMGDVGATGRVTGPHLHLSLIVRAVSVDESGQRGALGLFVDPEPVLRARLEADLDYLARRGPG
jgi:murein DD-endopeptidase MepM/ murein hydrolase activator NlpD